MTRMWNLLVLYRSNKHRRAMEHPVLGHTHVVGCFPEHVGLCFVNDSLDGWRSFHAGRIEPRLS